MSKTKTTGTATKLRDATGMRGDAALYKVEPPIEGNVFVVASAVDLDYGGFGEGLRKSETMIFPADEQGTVSDFGELAFVAHKSHVDCFGEIGYEVIS